MLEISAWMQRRRSSPRTAFEPYALSRVVGGARPRKVHLIVDRHSAHRSKSVRAWLADHKDEIESCFHGLPR
ncbi:hypothetical protein [Streptomyces sp. Qhu-G9]|uniref:hypothetical protein n=1 Tax=Streptomyces sp. Qhu-G9 TaxID=3452799 RepID=UPI002F2B6065